MNNDNPSSPLDLLWGIRAELRDMGVNTDREIEGAEAVEYLGALLKAIERRLARFWPAESTTGLDLVQAAQRVNDVYDAEAENDVIHDAVVSLADAYKRFQAAEPAAPTTTDAELLDIVRRYMDWGESVPYGAPKALLEDAGRVLRTADPTGEAPAFGRTIIVTGNPVDGLEFFGPFKDEDEAIDVAERWSSHEREYWLTTLQPPEAAS